MWSLQLATTAAVDTRQLLLLHDVYVHTDWLPGCMCVVMCVTCSPTFRTVRCHHTVVLLHVLLACLASDTGWD